MKKRIIISTIVSFVLLLAVVIAGLNAIFTVTAVNAEFTVFSSDGQSEANSLKTELDAFTGKSSVFLDLNDVQKTVEKYPAFRVERVEKAYPAAVEVRVRERRETYACKTENGYAVFDETGAYLYDKQENENRLGGKNILLEAFRFTFSSRERAEGQYAEELFQTLDVFTEHLTEVRANIERVALVMPAAESTTRNHFFYFYMREGVIIQIKNPLELTKEKATAAVQKYLSLSDMERVQGVIDVVDTNSGGVSVAWRLLGE